ncbi:MAG TPA: hypothetical protein VGI19_14165 [Candidatus Cybelea sp.]
MRSQPYTDLSLARWFPGDLLRGALIESRRWEEATDAAVDSAPRDQKELI